MMTTTQTMKRTLLLLTLMVGALMLSSTVALAITKSCEANLECLGTNNPDTLNGSDGTDFIFGRGAADTLKGFGVSDHLYGQGGADKLFGGSGGDDLTGGPGLDTLSGGADSDGYHFADGWGKEAIIDSATPANTVAFNNGPAKEEGVPASANLTIKLIAGEGPEVTNESGTSTINWEANVIDDVVSGSGDDQITGNPSDNRIIANAGGLDDIFGGAGDDIIRVDDGFGDDVVDCGESFVASDNDRVTYDPGDQIASNCEVKQESA